MGAAKGLLASVAILALAYAADLVVEEARRWGMSNFRSMEAFAVEAVIRIGVAALLVGLAWMVFRGPRSRPVGLAMALLGGYVAVLPALLWIDFDLMTRLPVALGAGAYRWAGAFVALLGLVELARPTTAPPGGPAAGSDPTAPQP